MLDDAIEPPRSNTEKLEQLNGEALLKTIKVPMNLANLSHRLPKANYATLQSDEVSLERMPVNPLEAMHSSQ